MINDDLDEEEVSWYSTRRWFTHAHERCVTERERVCVDCQLSRNAAPYLITPPLRVYPSLPPTNYLINYSSIDYV